jgi:hypothetical protein
MGPQIRPNRCVKSQITKDQRQDPHVSCPEEGGAGEAPPGVGRTPGSAEPGRLPSCTIFGGKVILIFLTMVANVFI